MNDDASVY